jgi:hypothetical protein
MTHNFYIVDVFAERPYAGNQLAVVVDANGLSSDTMQRIAAETADRTGIRDWSAFLGPPAGSERRLPRSTRRRVRDSDRAGTTALIPLVGLSNPAFERTRGSVVALRLPSRSSWFRERAARR